MHAVASIRFGKVPMVVVMFGRTQPGAKSSEGNAGASSSAKRLDAQVVSLCLANEATDDITPELAHLRLL